MITPLISDEIGEFVWPDMGGRSYYRFEGYAEDVVRFVAAMVYRHYVNELVGIRRGWWENSGFEMGDELELRISNRVFRIRGLSQEEVGRIRDGVQDLRRRARARFDEYGSVSFRRDVVQRAIGVLRLVWVRLRIVLAFGSGLVLSCIDIVFILSVGGAVIFWTAYWLRYFRGEGRRFGKWQELWGGVCVVALAVVTLLGIMARDQWESVMPSRKMTEGQE